MKSNKPKSINSLMSYMRDIKKININGSTQKRKLRNMGYYHGYKGYRFYQEPNSLLPYSDFSELQAVYDFDMKLKALLYSPIMFSETTIKNIALEVLIEETDSKRFADIYAKALNDYKSNNVGSTKYKEAINCRLNLRNKIYEDITRDYSKSFIVKHYYDKDEPVPIWAIFELITLGEFGNILKCTNIACRTKISKRIGLFQADDADGRLTELMVFLLKDLRNSVAHNNVVFDSRFVNHRIPDRLKTYISKETGIKGITFKSIIDYIILLAYIMKKCGKSKTEIKAFVKSFEQICEELRKQIPYNIYSSIIPSNMRSIINDISIYISSK